MKSVSLMLLRVGIGLLILIWAIIKLAATEAAIGVSDTYYGGILSDPTLQIVLGALQAVLAVAVIVGLFRRVTYPAMAALIGIGILPIWQSIVDPLGVIFGQDNVQILFFPSLTVFFATLVMLAFRDEDTLSLDARRGA
ncbi:hypothetical protein [Pyruvatibacter mobilis]|uniref:DoxX family membrane protein n=1 Tax=Pyruvatibacter mobilis TaxID=1712261 RepID=A0A845Q7V3_9HYPH|nr:hypothetical protein [Pyruvatibacter mobilis]NBG94524.1 hypothetical protein [Pyruvatibacter mobilis]QJD74042.1 hypothetical protein HG718_00655 [Pyruvatibacter mobilis]GGD03648.1 hypothetical protein GCM10011587_04230 [Pyruvatibacter mobilis]